jgi:RNA polymerase sigma-70 factor, ECF subfamily
MSLGHSAEAAAAASEPDRRTSDGAARAPAAAGAVTDLELIRQFRAGDEAAFDRLYLRHQEYVYHICLGLLTQPEDARDATQETFLRVYRKVGEFQAKAAFSTWLYRVAVNVCVGQLRKRPRLPSCSLEAEGVRELASEEGPVDAGLEQAVDAARVRQVVGELSPDYRVVLVLRYFRNLSYEEMQGVLGYSLAQVKVKLHRARRAFAKQWAVRAAEWGETG